MAALDCGQRPDSFARPEYFARLADGRGLVVDVREPDRIKPRGVVAFRPDQALL
ncbi:hypothetical protein [Alloactinosynnema sp. L-07]|nr:hypothetical protein [Alloactinosynnema sp. L-07]